MGELPEDVPQFPAGEGVHAHRRFVQQDEGRGGDQRAAQPQLLLHAAGEFARQASGEAFQAGHGEEAAEAFFPVLAGDAVHAGVKLHVSRTVRSSYRPNFCGM